MAKSLLISYYPMILNPKFQKIWPKNKVARVLSCLAWVPPNLADWQHLAAGFCFGHFAKLFLVRLVWNFGFKFLIYKENCIPIAIWIEENNDHPMDSLIKCHGHSGNLSNNATAIVYLAPVLNHWPWVHVFNKEFENFIM